VYRYFALVLQHRRQVLPADEIRLAGRPTEY
jgi:hypothetical protein